MTYLTEEQINNFHRDGFLLIPNFWTNNIIENLRNEIQQIISNLDLTSSRSVFTTAENMDAMNRDRHFLESGDVIRHFWEEKAFNEDGTPKQPLNECINKIGHALHDLNPEFQKVSYDARVGTICRELGLQIPTVVQSMYIFKSPNIGGEVLPHQDGTFLYTEPQSVLGFWWPLDQCTLENGCLWAVPGSHKNGVKRRFKRLDPPAYGTEFVPKENEFLNCDGGIPIECDPGSLVLIHHSVVHWSAPNKSSQPRHAYTIHIVDSQEGIVYPADNWLQRSDGKPWNTITEFV